MKVLTCKATQRKLQALHDQELQLTDQVAVSAHLEWCDECAATLAELRLVRLALRAAKPAGLATSRDEELSFLRAVVHRAKVEERFSFRATLREMFADMHLVYAGLGAAAAAFVCVAIMLGMMRLAMSESPESLAAMVRILNTPGSNENPVAVGTRVSLPRALDDPFSSPEFHADDAVFALVGVVTREGRVENLKLLTNVDPALLLGAHEEQLVDDLMGVVSRARFEPASRAGSPVAVNMVWIVAHTTVRGTQDSNKQTSTPREQNRTARAHFEPPTATWV